MKTGLRLGSHISLDDTPTHSDADHGKNEKSRIVLNFARFGSLVHIFARLREKSRSLSLAPFLARCRSLSLSLTGLEVVVVVVVVLGIVVIRLQCIKAFFYFITDRHYTSHIE